MLRRQDDQPPTIDDDWGTAPRWPDGRAPTAAEVPPDDRRQPPPVVVDDPARHRDLLPWRGDSPGDTLSRNGRNDREDVTSKIGNVDNFARIGPVWEPPCTSLIDRPICDGLS
jgi:hypothetical protein